jgi:hypothetical protein
MKNSKKFKIKNPLSFKKRLEIIRERKVKLIAYFKSKERK